MSEFSRSKRLGLTLLAAAAATLVGAGCKGTATNPDGGGTNDGGATDSGQSSPTTITWANVAPGQAGALATAVTANGGTQYYTAFDVNGVPGVYSVVVGGSPAVVFSGDPLAMPSGLAISADDSTLFVADEGADMTDGGTGPDLGAVFSLPTGGGQLTAIAITGLQKPQALTLSSDGSSLLVSAQDTNGVPAVFKVSASGGAATALTMPGEVNDPGEATDHGGTLWVAEHRANTGYGALVQRTASGPKDMSTNAYAEMGFPGAIVSSAGGDTVYVAFVDADGNGAIDYTASAGTGAGGHVTLAPSGTKLKHPSGMSRGKNVNVFGINDGEGASANVYNGR